MKLRNIWFSFFQGMLNSSFVGGDWGVPLRVGLSVTSPRRAVGFPLQSLTWVKVIPCSVGCCPATNRHIKRLKYMLVFISQL